MAAWTLAFSWTILLRAWTILSGVEASPTRRKVISSMTALFAEMEMQVVAEGVETTRSAHELAVKLYVDMPLTAQIHALLYKDQSPRGALAALMGRDLKPELAGIAW